MTHEDQELSSTWVVLFKPACQWSINHHSEHLSFIYFFRAGLFPNERKFAHVRSDLSLPPLPNEWVICGVFISTHPVFIHFTVSKTEVVTLCMFIFLLLKQDLIFFFFFWTCSVTIGCGKWHCPSSSVTWRVCVCVCVLWVPNALAYEHLKNELVQMAWQCLFTGVFWARSFWNVLVFASDLRECVWCTLEHIHFIYASVQKRGL